MAAQPAKSAVSALVLTAILMLSLLAGASEAGALAIKLPSLGAGSTGTTPVEVSLPAVSIPLLGGSVSTPAVSVSLPVPVLTPSPPGGESPAKEPSVEVTTGAPTTPSSPPAPANSPTAPPSSTSTASSTSSSSPATTTTAGTSEPRGLPASPPARAVSSKKRGAVDHARRTSGAGAVAPSSIPPSLTATAVPAGSVRPATAARKASADRSSHDPLTAIGGDLPLPIPVPDWSKPIILVLLLLAIWFAARSRLAALRAKRLEGRQVTLLRDLDVMQAAVVPAIPASVGGLTVSVAYRPADGPAAGGDFYDVFSPEPGKVVMILGDVSGHGHEAVSHAALTRYTLRAYLQAGLEPRAALALAGRVMADPAVEHFATVAVGVYREREGTLTYASAGHPAPILVGSAASSSSEACCSPPIGWSVPTGRRQTTLSLPAGTAACFFTDGLIEARGREDLLLGRDRLEEIFGVLGPAPQAEDLLERVREASLATPDDMAACILTPQRTGTAAPTHIEEMEVDAKALRGRALPRFLADCLLPSVQAGRAIAQAKRLAGTSGTALIRVKLGQEGTRAIATVLPGSGDVQPGKPADSSELDGPLPTPSSLTQPERSYTTGTCAAGCLARRPFMLVLR